MRLLSTNVKTLLLLDNIEFCYLVRIITPTETWLYTTNPYDIVVPDLGTFSFDSGLAIVEPPRLSQSIDREPYKITFVDPAHEKRIAFENGLIGAKTVSWLCFKNTSGADMSGVPPRSFLATLPDLIVAYSGIVDSPVYTADPAEGRVIAALECSSPMAGLSMSKPFHTSKSAMRARMPNDTAFDQVLAANKQIMKWGKA